MFVDSVCCIAVISLHACLFPSLLRASTHTKLLVDYIYELKTSANQTLCDCSVRFKSGRPAFLGSVSVQERAGTGKTSDLSDFEHGKIVGG